MEVAAAGRGLTDAALSLSGRRSSAESGSFVTGHRPEKKVRVAVKSVAGAAWRQRCICPRLESAATALAPRWSMRLVGQSAALLVRRRPYSVAAAAAHLWPQSPFR